MIQAVYPYGQVETEHLQRCDPQLGAAITRIGMLQRSITPDPFAALAMSFVSQQISGKAADTIWARLEQLTGGVTPQSLAAATPEALRACGLPTRKVAWLGQAAQAAQAGLLQRERLQALSDEEVIKHLCSLNGVGCWTAEMLLIFCLCRPNVLSWGDLGIRKGIQLLYGLPTLTREAFEACRSRYHPYATVASFYLWAVAGGA